MREVDRRSKYDRRVFLKGATTAVPAVAIATSAGLAVSDAWDGKAAKDPATKVLISDGVARLDKEAIDRHKMPYAQVAWENDRVALLQRIETTDFFQKVRGDLIVSLYNQKELWPKFGYEGSSAEHGGYIKRGFADIDWLPKA